MKASVSALFSAVFKGIQFVLCTPHLHLVLHLLCVLFLFGVCFSTVAKELVSLVSLVTCLRQGE